MAVFLGIVQAGKSGRASSQLSDTLERLRASSEETTRVQILNTELQQRLLSSSETIERLTERSINTAIGGDSFAYLMFPTFSGSGGFPVVVHVGDFPLSDLDVRLVDRRRFREMTARTPHLGIRDLMTGSGPIIHIGSLAAHRVWTTTAPIQFSSQEEQDFNIFFTARNSTWIQNLKLHRVAGKWTYATRVRRDSETIFAHLVSPYIAIRSTSSRLTFAPVCIS